MLKLIVITFMALLIMLEFCTWSYVHASEDSNIVAITIAAEACGEGEQGMEAVMHVIKNRMDAWHKTAEQVVTAKNQFFGATAVNRYKRYAECQEVADRLATLISTGQTGIDFTNGAMYIRQPSEKVRPWHGKEVYRYKGHIFHAE